MTPEAVVALVRALDAGVAVVQRPDGGFELGRGGNQVGIAPNALDAVLKRFLEDGVKALELMAAPRPADGDSWRAGVEARLAALERLTPPTGQKANTPR